IAASDVERRARGCRDRVDQQLLIVHVVIPSRVLPSRHAIRQATLTGQHVTPEDELRRERHPTIGGRHGRRCVSLRDSGRVPTYRGRVWPANRRDDDSGEIPVSPDASVQPATPLLAPAPAVRGVADTARDAWRSELAELGGTSP